MAFGEVAKQIAQQAILSATDKPAPAPPVSADSAGAMILAQIAAMQKALKEDEELVVLFQSGAERIRVFEIFLASPHVAVLIGTDLNRAGARAISAVAALQLVCRVAKVPAGVKPARVGLRSAKP